MTQLGRPAKGLPRYYMDCGWYRHPRFVGLMPEVLFVFEAMVGYCTQHGTNGHAPAHPEDLSIALGIRASVVKKALPRLLERDALFEEGAEVVVRGWGSHNPTSEEVEDLSRERSKAGTRGNHVRWHTERGVADPDCEFCRKESQTESHLRSLPDRSGVSHGMGWDGNNPLTPTGSDER